MTLQQTASGRWTGEYINFDVEPTLPGRKTKTWIVSSKYVDRLGVVRWLTRWRKYTFQPEPNCVFEETCLRDIAQFIKDRTYNHKGRKVTLAEYVGG